LLGQALGADQFLNKHEQEPLSDAQDHVEKVDDELVKGNAKGRGSSGLDTELLVLRF